MLFSQDDAGLQQSLMYTLCRSNQRHDSGQPTTTKIQFRAAMHPSITPRSEIIVLPAVDKDPNSVECGSQVLASVKRTLKAVGQRAAVVGVDGGLWQKMHQQLYTRASFDETILLILGPFHVVKAFLSALGDFVRGTGWGQALIQARIVGGDASIESALSGAAVYRGIHLHAVFSQAVWDCLLSEFVLENSTTVGLAELRLAASMILAGVDVPSSDAAAAVDELRAWVAGKESGTLSFWWSYLQHCQRLENYMGVVRVVHNGGLKTYSTALEGLLPLFVATDKTNYRRMIPLQLQLFKLVPTKFPTLVQSLELGIGLAVSKTGLAGSLVGIDLVMEWVNRDCKGPCRLASFLQPNARARFLYTLSAMLRLGKEMLASVTTTPRATGSQEKRVEPKILRDIGTLSAVLVDHVGPLSAMSRPEIQTLFSHAVVPMEHTTSILIGTPAAALEAIKSDQQRLQAGSVAVLFKELTKVRGVTVASALRVTAAKAGKVTFAKAQFSALCKFVTMSERLPIPLSLSLLLQYELFKFPSALFRQDGSLRDAKKAEMVPLLFPPDGEQPATPARLLALCSGNDRGLLAADFSMVERRSLKGTSTFGDFLTTAVCKVLGQATAVSASSVLLALDHYTYDGSPKGAAQEHLGGKTCPVYAKVNIDGVAPTSWSTFLSRWQNKHQIGEALIAWLPGILETWRQQGGKLITVYVARAGCGFVLRSDGTELEPFPALQGPEFAEADHTLIWGVSALCASGVASSVVILADDTDIKLMATMYAERQSTSTDIALLYNKGSSGQYLSHIADILQHSQQQFTENGAACIWAMCIWTGVDTTSGIHGISKARAVARLRDMFATVAMQSACAVAARRAITLLAAGCPDILQDEAAIVPEEIMDLFEQLMLWLHRQQQGDSSLVRLRRRLFETKNPDVLPPTREATRQHLLRCVLQVRLFLAALSNDQHYVLPNPHWLGWSSSSGVDARVWRAIPLPPGTPSVPPELRAASACGCTTGCKNERCGCVKGGMFCSPSCKCHAGAACQNAMPELDVLQRGGNGDALVLTELEPPSDGEFGDTTDSSDEALTDSEPEFSDSSPESDGEP